MEKQGKLEKTNHPVCLLYLKQAIQSRQLLYLPTEHSNATQVLLESHRPSNNMSQPEESTVNSNGNC